MPDKPLNPTALSQESDESAAKLNDIELVALAMCRIEMRKKCRRLEDWFSEVERTWRRHIPEAVQLLKEVGDLAAMRSRVLPTEGTQESTGLPEVSG